MRDGTIWVVIADIHANLPALQGVQADAIAQAKAAGVSEAALRYVSLGDVVDYGPQPGECLAWVASKGDQIITILGNHDWEAARCPDTMPGLGVARDYWPLLIWTRCQLTQEQKGELVRWPPILVDIPGLPDFVLSHSDFDKGNDYSKYPETRQELIKQVEEQFRKPLQAKGKHYGLIGHSHKQLLYWFRDGKGTVLSQPEQLVRDDWLPMPQGDVIINPGSVGQPRRVHNGDPLDQRAQYLLLDTRADSVQYKFRRVEYNVEDTLAQFDQITLPQPLPDSCHPGPRGEIKLDARTIADLSEKLAEQIRVLKMQLAGWLF